MFALRTAKIMVARVGAAHVRRASSLVSGVNAAVSSLPMREAVRYSAGNVKVTADELNKFAESHANALTEYGFRRNLLGLKTLGVIFALAGFVGSAWSTYSLWTTTQNPPAVSIVAGLITGGLLLTWLMWVTERTAKLSADRYARFLLEAALEQE